MAIKKRNINPRLISGIKYLLIDISFIVLIYYLVGVLGSSFPIDEVDHYKIITIVSYALVLKIAIYLWARFYRTMYKYAGFEELFKIVLVVGFSQLVLTAALVLLNDIKHFNLFQVLMAGLLEVGAIVFVRFYARIIRLMATYFRELRKKGVNVLIIGAGAGGKLVLSELRTNAALAGYYVVGFVDDDKKKIGGYIKGIRVYGPINNIPNLIKEHDIKEVIIGIADIDPSRLNEIVNLVAESSVIIKRLPLMKEMKKNEEIQSIKDVKIEDLLNRDVIKVENNEIAHVINGHVVMVTGAGGSIGSELCRQIVNYRPKTLILLDIYEHGVYDLQQELNRLKKTKYLSFELIVLIGSVYNYQRMESIFKEYHPEVVFHAAAYKHVPLMEDSPVEAVRTNMIGTYNIANLCNQYRAKQMVLVSTDKAVRPTNVMGATKRFAELVLQNYADKSFTKYSCVRFGNVLGSNGSVIPLFKRQIEQGGPVTVTHEEVRRYFMTIPEAVSLILQSSAYAKGGEIFIFDMGKPVRIYELAEKMIRMAGYRPNIDIKIEVTGLRPGEKLFEEILVDESTHVKTSNDKIYIESDKESRNIEEDIIRIKDIFESISVDEIKDFVHEFVSSYQAQH